MLIEPQSTLPATTTLFERSLLQLAEMLHKDVTAEYHGEDGIVNFVRQVLRAEPTPYQEDVLRRLVAEKRLAVYAPHGVGKTALSSWVVWWAMLAFNTDVKVVTTASSWRQVQRFTWPEIHLWGTRIDWRAAGISPLRRGRELMDTSMRVGNKNAFAVASDTPALIEGAHATTLVYVFDEAKSIPSGIFDSAEGAFSNAGDDTGNQAYALAISTPGERSGRFYDICTRRPGFSDWGVRHISLDEAIAAKRISQRWVDERREQWGDSSVFQNRVLGEFADSAEDSVIPLSWIEAAIDRWRDVDGKGEGPVFIGCDPAYKGEDKTAIVIMRGRVVEAIETHAKQDTMQTAGMLIARMRTHKAVLSAVDVIGVGAGVYDRVAEVKMPVLAVNAAHKAEWYGGKPMTDASGQLNFVNTRSALWWFVREALDPTLGNLIALPPIDRMIGDLTAPLWKYRSDGKIEVESKDVMRVRIGRSPDTADALALALFASLRALRKRLIMV